MGARRDGSAIPPWRSLATALRDPTAPDICWRQLQIVCASRPALTSIRIRFGFLFISQPSAGAGLRPAEMQLIVMHRRHHNLTILQRVTNVYFLIQASSPNI